MPGGVGCLVGAQPVGLGQAVAIQKEQ